MKRKWSLLVAALSLTACVSTDVGNPDEEGITTTVAFAGSRTMIERFDPGDVLVLSSGVELDTVLLGFDRFKLRDAEKCDKDNVIDVETTVVSDLIRDTHYPELPTIIRDVRKFCRFELRIKKVPAPDVPTGAPDGIADRAMWLTGRLADGTPFELETVDDDNLKLEAVDGFFELPTDASRLFLTFVWNDWFANLAWDGFTPDADGVIRIDKSVDDAWVKTFRDNLKHSARLFLDTDGDGVLDDAEAIDSLAVGSSE